jgi:O-antigen ligase
VYSGWRRRGKLASLLLIAVVSLPVLALVPQSYWNEMKTIQTATENDDTGAQRLYYWNIAWEMFKDHPIVGVGRRTISTTRSSTNRRISRLRG